MFCIRLMPLASHHSQSQQDGINKATRKKRKEKERKGKKRKEKTQSCCASYMRNWGYIEGEANDTQRPVVVRLYVVSLPLSLHLSLSLSSASERSIIIISFSLQYKNRRRRRRIRIYLVYTYRLSRHCSLQTLLYFETPTELQQLSFFFFLILTRFIFSRADCISWQQD